MLYLKELNKIESQIAQKWPKMHPVALIFSGGGSQLPPPGGGGTSPHLALPPSLVPAIDTFVPATSNLINKNPASPLEGKGLAHKHALAIKAI